MADDSKTPLLGAGGPDFRPRGGYYVIDGVQFLAYGRAETRQHSTLHRTAHGAVRLVLPEPPFPGKSYYLVTLSAERPRAARNLKPRRGFHKVLWAEALYGDASIGFGAAVSALCRRGDTYELPTPLCPRPPFYVLVRLLHVGSTASTRFLVGSARVEPETAEVVVELDAARIKTRFSSFGWLRARRGYAAQQGDAA